MLNAKETGNRIRVAIVCLWDRLLLVCINLDDSTHAACVVVIYSVNLRVRKRNCKEYSSKEK